MRLSKLCPHHEHCPSRPGKAKLKKHPVNELSTNALALKDTTILVVYKTSCSMGNHVLGNGTSKDGLKTKKLLTLQYQTQQQVVCIPFVVEPASSTDTLQTKSTCMNSAGSPPNNKFSHQNSGWKRSGKRIRNLQTSVSFNSISAGFCTVKFSLAASARHSPGYALGQHGQLAGPPISLDSHQHKMLVLRRAARLRNRWRQSSALQSSNSMK